MQIFTKDSSITLYNSEFCEAYHNISDGALLETLHKHIFPAFKIKENYKSLKILDLCFGLGFNTFCAIKFAQSSGFSGNIELHSPEINENLLLELLAHPYPKELEFAHFVLESLIKKREYCKENLKIYLHLGDAREILNNFSNDSFDIIFQDPFSPRKNRSLWTYEYFKTLYKISKKEVIITTYSHNSCMLYTAFLAGFYPFKLKQKEVRDSIILTKSVIKPKIKLENIIEINAIDIYHKIKTNPKLMGLYD